jgi:phage terminase Nu1 subunit (DNA packaging protein)
MERSSHERAGRRDASTAELLRDLSEQTSRLVRQELELAKAELSLVFATWLAALVVAVVYGATAGALALMGKTRVQRAIPPVPQDSIDSVKEDVQWTKTRAQQGRG